MSNPRKPLTDAFNSFAHVLFGYAAPQLPFITPVFLLYQIMTPNKDTITDIIEFTMGFIVSKNKLLS